MDWNFRLVREKSEVFCFNFLIFKFSAEYDLVEFKEGEEFSISSPQNFNHTKMYRLSGPPGTIFEIKIRPERFHFSCFDDSIRIFDENSRVDFLTGICGMFDTKPVTTCGNKVAVEFLADRLDKTLEIDIQNARTVSNNTK